MGIAVQLMVAAIGLTSLLNVVSEALGWIRWLGAAYLVYLGIRQWRSASDALDFDTASISKTNLFVQGLIITIPNPKSLIFIAAFLPQFIDAVRPLGTQFTVIVPTFLVITFTVTSLWALLAGKARRFMRSQRVSQSVSKTSGGLMIISGIGLALARRSN